jgi:hypothetical protein
MGHNRNDKIRWEGASEVAQDTASKKVRADQGFGIPPLTLGKTVRPAPWLNPQ